ncbi:hypothetical protein [Brevibacterium sp. 1718]|uniref:hypothetical protein n=1 Tax=Brevibacterium sp. 1718 TaxID=3413510 RepID=UPI003DA9D12E
MAEDVCIVVQVAKPQGTATVALIGNDTGKPKMNFELRGSEQPCRVDTRWHSESQDEKCKQKLIPPVNTLGFRVVVMGVCLWFENPIACLFEQVVMPEHLIFLVRQSPGQTVVHLWWVVLRRTSRITWVDGVFGQYFLVNLLTP